MIKFSKVFILFILLLFILSPFVLAITPQNYNSNYNRSMGNLLSDTENYSNSEVPSVPVQDVGLRIFRIVQVLGTILSVILMPVCLVLGIMYIAKSESSTAKKFTIGFLIIFSPYALFILVNILSIILLMLRLF